MIPRQPSEVGRSKKFGQLIKFLFQHIAMKPFSFPQNRQVHNSIFAVTRNGNTYVTHITDSRDVIGKSSHHIGIGGMVRLLSDRNRRSNKKLCRE